MINKDDETTEFNKIENNDILIEKVKRKTVVDRISLSRLSMSRMQT